MSKNSLERDVPFDQFNRQVQVKSILDALRTKQKPYFKILDVGGYKGRTADFLQSDNVTVLDIFDIKEEGYVRGTALNMPFEDGSFDFVVSYDVLEHIPADEREKFVDECSRVSKSGFIICAPHNSEANVAAELSLNEYYRRLHRKPHPWLREHIENGLPDFNKVEKRAITNGFLTSTLTSNRIQLWAAMQQAIFLNSKYPMAAEKLTEVNEKYNTRASYDRGVPKGEAYRIILCCLKEATDHKTIQNLIKTSQANPAGPSLEIELYEALAEYNRTILQKTATLALQYKKLHAFEKKRAYTLQVENEELHRVILNHKSKHNPHPLMKISKSLLMRGRK